MDVVDGFILALGIVMVGAGWWLQTRWTGAADRPDISWQNLQVTLLIGVGALFAGLVLGG
jgi:hypothetical protein